MNLLTQRCWHISVNREGENLLKAKSTYSDGTREKQLFIIAAIKTLEIEQAYLLEISSSDDNEKEREILALQGITAHIGSGKQINRALQGFNDEIITSLVYESIAGILQAESSIFLERGYSSPEEYNQACDKFLHNLCRYYSNLERVKVPWDAFAMVNKRRRSLFNRFISQHLFENSPGRYELIANLLDSFHTIGTRVELDRDMRVLKSQAFMSRVPDDVCRESAACLHNLHGKDLASMSRKQLLKLLGEGQGCTHLFELMSGGAQTLKMFRHECQGGCY